MFNTLKTTLLLGLLTGLILGFGQYFGGQDGVWFALIFAIVMNVGSYWFSDRFVLRMYGAKTLEPNEEPRLQEIVRDIAARAGMPMPRVAVVHGMPGPNAFATGRNPSHAVVAVSPSLLQILDEQELRAVLAHEMGHIKNRDILIASVAATLAGVISSLANMAMFFGGGRSREGMNPLAMLVMVILTPIVAMMIQFAISRSREYGADDRSAEYADARALASALRKLDSVARRMGLVGDPKHEATAHLFIVNPFRSSFIQRMFSTHPPIEERIARLEGMMHS
jgi:heat shock protein HtpX